MVSDRTHRAAREEAAAGHAAAVGRPAGHTGPGGRGTLPYGPKDLALRAGGPGPAGPRPGARRR
ncbi:hypothetical protein GCM10018793_54230 [Streptomyces sulfonofaciens]|uniref:Uncharacterized protein n=1 Tax=Streptomyces sulfonofaciens TaxID=68272 RepID=A0A919GIZ0_9ACTN|nr:hypothetical protein GCM10018793_54230 [Streptomyces sulfonofaciens]